MPKAAHTEIGVILDESGSMGPIRDDVIGGYNTFIDTQKAEPGTAKFTLVVFNSELNVALDGVDIQRAEHLNEKNYRPGGMTALLDAIGTTIHSIGKRLADTPEDERPEKVIIAIMTDGAENASKEYTHERIMNMIKTQREEFSWEFIFLAAGQDAINESEKLGIGRGRTMEFSANSRGMGMSMSSMSKAVSSVRSSGMLDEDWKTAPEENK
jgi:uncharacterized protein YegL